MILVYPSDPIVKDAGRALLVDYVDVLRVEIQFAAFAAPAGKPCKRTHALPVNRMNGTDHIPREGSP
jgi:hypothetical protein